jgi:hypothetical protein
MQIRIAADDSFRAWRAKHLDELNDFEQGYAVAVLREDRRPVQAKAMLHLTAVRLAKSNDLCGSVRMRESAINVEQAELKDRRKRIDSKFDHLRATLFERQRNDLAILNRNLSEELKRLSVALREALSQPARRLVLTARTLTQKTILKASATARTVAQKRLISKTLHE